MDYVNTWGLYQCFKGTDDELVAPDCRDDFFSLQPNGKVFQCVSSEGDMITLKYGDRLFVVNDSLYKNVKEPLYKVGEQVEIIEKGVVGKIVDVNWHFKENAPFYTVEIDGKKSGKRYTDSDLREVE